MNDVHSEYGVIANVINDRKLRTNAKVWILYCNGNAEDPVVLGLNKFGKKIRKFIPFKRLTNFRASWIPENIREHVEWKFDQKDKAQELASNLGAMWSDIRFFSRDGQRIIKEGQPVSAAFAIGDQLIAEHKGV